MNKEEFILYQTDKKSLYPKLLEIDNDKLRYINRYIVNINNLFKILNPKFIKFRYSFKNPYVENNKIVDLPLSKFEIVDEHGTPLSIFKEVVNELKRSVENLIELEIENFEFSNVKNFEKDLRKHLNILYSIEDGLTQENKNSKYDKILLSNKKYLSVNQHQALLNLVSYLKGDAFDFGNKHEIIDNTIFYYIHMNNKEMDQNTEDILNFKHKLNKKFKDEIIFLISECLLFKHLNPLRFFQSAPELMQINFNKKESKVFLLHQKERIKEFDYSFINPTKQTFQVDVYDIRKTLESFKRSFFPQMDELVYEKIMENFNKTEKDIIKNRIGHFDINNIKIKRF